MYIPKPIDIKEVLKAIEQFLTQKEYASSPAILE
jgi:DNA-binding response OmpR family regulator